MSGGLLTDLYELHMAASYLRRHMDGTATFSLFVRELPPSRGYLVAAGLEPALQWLEDFRLAPSELDYLRALGFDDESLEHLAALQFSGDVWAVPEGRVVLAGEPLLEVTAPLAEGQMAETFLLNQLTHQTSLASKAARCRLAAPGMDLMEFGFRRVHGVDAAMAVARCAAMVGFGSTSNVEAARRYGLVPAGTMAHSFVGAFGSELDAFRAYATDHPDGVTLLVDTYDTLAGVANAATVIVELGLRAAAVRLDSGDMVSLSRAARQILDAAGLRHVRIVVSGSLDEHDLAALASAGAPVDAAGIGTRLGVSADAPYLDSAYKLVALGDRPVVKLSEGKATLPGAKQVFRGSGVHDVLGLRHEGAPPGTEPLLVPVMVGGRRTSDAAPQHGDDSASAVAETARQRSLIDAARARFEADAAQLPAAARTLSAPRAPVPVISPALRALAEQATTAARHAGPGPERGGRQ